MNKKILFAMPLGLLLMACAAQEASGPIVARDCPAYEVSECDDSDKKNPKVTIYLDDKKIEPECVVAKKGRVIIFEIESVDPIAKGSVEIIPKNSDNDWWLAGSNSPNKKKILVLAPKKKESGGYFPPDTYSYEVHTPDWCFDPRVHIEN